MVNNGGSGWPGGAENGQSSGRRRGSGFGTILSTFGIRAGPGTGESSVSGELQGQTLGHAAPIDIVRQGAAVPSSGASGAPESAPGSAPGAGATAANHNSIMGTTPFDDAEHPNGPAASQSAPPAAHGNAQADTHLPINLILGQIETNGHGAGSSNNINDQIPLTSPPVQANPLMQAAQSLKNVHHFIYPAVRPASAPLLHLDFPTDWPQAEAVDDETVRLRKDKNGLFTLRLTPFIDNAAAGNPGFYFEPMVRTAGPGSQLVIGRYTEKVREAISSLPDAFHPAVFKSKVVSRTHGVFKVDDRGNWFVKDVKSSSGTFLNHQRLSQPTTMSKDYLLKDGDILQLGLDFRGGTEEIYRCVKMRVELNKSWKRKANAFNKEAIQKMKNLQLMTAGAELEDCSICLSKIKPCQAVFIAPCSHAWHYRCVRRLIASTYPHFVCPNCRSVCDLEADLDSDDDDDDEFEEDDDVYMPPTQPLDNKPTFTSVHEGSISSLPNGTSDRVMVQPTIPEHYEEFHDEDDDIPMIN